MPSTATPAHDLFSVRDQSFVVTGGSRGIGRMIAAGLVQAGARVLITGRDEERLSAAAAEIGALGACEHVAADVTTSEGIAAIVASATDFAPAGLHGLVNNAGVTWGSPLESFPRKGWDKVLSTNLVSVFELTVALLPLLEESATAADPARVVTIGSVDGLRVPEFDNFSYSASKAGAHMLTRHLADRLAARHITINTIAPGAFPSDMTDFALRDESSRQQILSTIPLGRIGEPDDIAAAVIYLTSTAGRYLTGITLTLDGGISAFA